MKPGIILVSAGLLLGSTQAFGKNVCDKPDAVQAAKEQLARSLDISETDDMSLTNIEPHKLTDGTPVCTGKLSNPKFETISVWNVSYMSGQPVVSVLQAITPAYFKSNAYEQQQQEAKAHSDAFHQEYQQRVQQEQQQFKKEKLKESLGPIGDIGGALGLFN